jgi:hypothetical protein
VAGRLADRADPDQAGLEVIRALGILLFFAILLWLYSMANAEAQEHHERHHAYYQNWVNRNDLGCCDNRDCGELSDDDERTTNGKLEVRILGRWCEVKPWHYLKRGNAPNAASSHLCVQKFYSRDQNIDDPCDRLLCYQPKPGI